jgi:zinc protease
MARRQTAHPAPAWTGDLPVFERTLANGLKALVLPRTNASIVVCDLYYPIGSVDDMPGKTGLAHFVEHMLFKGTARFPKGYIDRLAFLASGQSNAETGEDLTHYWFAFPTERWELALAIESDRMLGARFEPAEVDAERQVIGEERARELDSPLGRLDQTHLAVSYLVHPYRNPILGWPQDLNATTADDLSAFHAARYRPDGSVLVIVGNLDPEYALDRIESHFGPLTGRATGPTPPPPPEPRQTGRREFQLLESEAIARGLFGWRTAPRGHPDTPVLDVLADVLCCGRRSRLWDGLVETRKLATWVDANQDSARLSGQFLIQIEAATGVDPSRIEAEIFAEIGRLAKEGPSVSELERSRHRLEAAWRWEQEDVSGLAGGLGHVALWDDWRNWQAEHRAALAVSTDDVRRAAATYFGSSGLTVGWSLPRSARSTISMATVGRSPSPFPPRALVAPAWPVGVSIPSVTASLPGYSPQRFILPNGLRVLTERRAGTGTLALELHVDSGLLREEKPGLAYLTARLREEGTTSRSAEVLSTAIENVGGTLDISATGVSARVRAEDLELALDLMADVTIRPAFPAEAVSWAQARIVAELEGDRDDAGFLADSLFRSLIYGKHPYARDPRGTVRTVSSLSQNDAQRHHELFASPANAFLVVVGDFDPQILRTVIRRHLGRWSSPSRAIGARSVVDAAALAGIPERKSRSRRVHHDGEQVHLLMGHLGVPRLHRDFDALCVLDHILGSGPGFTDRLSRVLRDELGLAYSVGGGITDSADVGPGVFRLYAGTGPRKAERALKALREQVIAIHAGEFSNEDVERARAYLRDAWIFDFQTVGQRAERLLELEYFGLPLTEPLAWPERVARLTPARVRKAARERIDPDALVVVEYGPISARRSKLKK